MSKKKCVLIAISAEAWASARISNKFDQQAPDLGDDHRANYEKLVSQYSFSHHVSIGDTLISADYYWVGQYSGVDYYTPNDEEWGSIIALDHEHQLAADTGFFEMDNIKVPNSDYQLVAREDTSDRWPLLPAPWAWGVCITGGSMTIEIEEDPLLSGYPPPCSNPEGHEWMYTGTAYGGDDSSYNGEGRCYCAYCGADGDA